MIRRIKKRYVVLGLLLAFLAYSWTWTYTSYGRLDYRAAFSLHALTFDLSIKPNPEAKSKITLPMNGFFAVSALLPGEPVAATRDVHIPGDGVQIPARIYWPTGYNKSWRQVPVIVYYHGGGFVTGSVAIFDQLTRAIANATRAIVVSVDYRLAPAHPWPAGANDAFAAAKWAANNAESLGGDPSRLIVGGDSAGGNLAAVVALKARDSGGPALAGEILYYPVVDMTATDYPGKRHFADGYGLSARSGVDFHRAYLGQVSEADRANPEISPVKAASVKGLPPTLLVSGGFDPLTDASNLYLRRLREAGVPAHQVYFPEIIHGFMSVPLFSQRRAALIATGAWTDKLFDRQPQ